METLSREAYRSPFIPPAAGERDCLISRHDLEQLLRQSETEKERGYRNLAVALAVSGGLGVLSTVTSHFGELLSGGLGPVETLFLTLMIATTMASTALAVFFHRRLQRCGLSDLRPLDTHIRERLAAPPDDPRYWP